MSSATQTHKLAKWVDMLLSGGIYFALGVVLLLAAIVSPDFYHPVNLLNVVRQASALGILSIAQTMVMIAGGVDLSVAATMQLAVVLMAQTSRGLDSRVPAVLAGCLLVGAFVGWFNGTVITRLRIPAFLVTLATSVAFTGARLLATNASPSSLLPPVVRFVGGGNIGPVPVAVLILAGVAVASHILLTRTTFGRRLRARGANLEAARLSGVQTSRILVLTYMLSGILAALAGLLLAGYAGHADQWTGKGYGLDSIAAVVVGGGDFVGGVGTVGGTVAGVLLVSALLNLVLLLNLSVQYQLIVKGLVVIGAVALYSARRNA
jgi:ribose transport system permease protein